MTLTDAITTCASENSFSTQPGVGPRPGKAELKQRSCLTGTLATKKEDKLQCKNLSSIVPNCYLSGAGAVQNGELVGIYSHSNGCNVNGAEIVYTRIYKYADWLTQTMAS
ncbi:unnamed protein product [Oikopleura dioica]|uniref:Peptidase S1 domain-containing protein n=1 Tax=Oikopleura dioica TaxID=34765 RepID=E4YKD5_OIKDI|nr:unnamed protein product [Oikopleura dioica]